MGILISFIILMLWLIHLSYSLFFFNIESNYLRVSVHVLVQAYLFTGLFITGHDAMHNSISKNKKINKFIGLISSFLFAGLSFQKLVKNHKLHHKYSGTEKDPDFSNAHQNIFIWFGVFLKRYVTIQQILVMALFFNIIKIYVYEINIWLFWVLPALISTFQLFYFGTYRPHKLPHLESMLPHNARTQKKNHFWAMLSCYFFGYHSEHHENPSVPWWKLYQEK